MVTYVGPCFKDSPQPLKISQDSGFEPWTLGSDRALILLSLTMARESTQIRVFCKCHLPTFTFLFHAFFTFTFFAYLYRNLAKAQGRIDSLQKELDSVEQKVKKLNEKIKKMTTEAAKLQMELEESEKTINAAENLVGKLDGEYKRWSGQVRRGRTYSALALSNPFHMYVLL